MSDWSEAVIRWDGAVPSADVIAAVRAELASDLVDLDTPSELVFHTVILTDDWDGPSVTLWGEDGFDGFIAEYHAVSKWVPLSELDPDA